MKKLLHIIIALALSCNIVWGYAGIHLFKMICAAENGKAVVSFTDIRNTCEHQHQSSKKSCCTPESAPQQTINKSCCVYTHFHLGLEDYSTVNEPQNSCKHYLTSAVLNPIVWGPLMAACANQYSRVKPPNPPLSTQNVKVYLSQIQTYLI